MSWSEAIQSIGLAVGGGLVGATAPMVADHYAWKRKRTEDADAVLEQRDIATRQMLRDFRTTATNGVVAANQFANGIVEAAEADPNDPEPWPSGKVVDAWRDAYVAFVLASEDLRSDMTSSSAVATVDQVIELMREANDLSTRGGEDPDGPKDLFDTLSRDVREGLRKTAEAVKTEIASRHAA